MDIEIIWTQFLITLKKDALITQAFHKKSAGIPFLYLFSVQPHEKDLIEKTIRISAAEAMKGKQLHSETIFVRQEYDLFIYRHRFYVPQRKMFCCGNLCSDCIRLNPNN